MNATIRPIREVYPYKDLEAFNNFLKRGFHSLFDGNNPIPQLHDLFKQIEFDEQNPRLLCLSQTTDWLTLDKVFFHIKDNPIDLRTKDGIKEGFKRIYYIQKYIHHTEPIWIIPHLVIGKFILDENTETVLKLTTGPLWSTRISEVSMTDGLWKNTCFLHDNWDYVQQTDSAISFTPLEYSRGI